jgi:hypothetical protein
VVGVRRAHGTGQVLALCGPRSSGGDVRFRGQSERVSSTGGVRVSSF